MPESDQTLIDIHDGFAIKDDTTSPDDIALSDTHPKIAPPHSFGQQTAQPKDEDEGQVYLENQYGEMEPTAHHLEQRWGRGQIPEASTTASCADQVVGKAQELLGKATGNQVLEEKGAHKKNGFINEGEEL